VEGWRGVPRSPVFCWPAALPLGNDDLRLYDLSKDPAKLIDLSQERPKLRKEMIGMWKQYSEDVGVVLPPGGVMRMDMNLPTPE